MSAPTAAQISDLQHALGIDRERRIPYRNYYCAAAGNPDMEALVEMGLMAPGRTINEGQDRLYHVTDEGRRVAFAALPKPEKLTRSQRRYRRFLAADTGMRFGEWLRMGEP